MMEIKRMRDLREDADKTQQCIADYLNMHRSVYRRYESGQRETPAWVVMKLADFYHVSTDYLGPAFPCCCPGGCAAGYCRRG